MEGEKRSAVVGVRRACCEGDDRNGSGDRRGTARRGSRDLRKRKALQAEVADFIPGTLDGRRKIRGVRLLAGGRGDVRNRVRERRLLAPQQAQNKHCV